MSFGDRSSTKAKLHIRNFAVVMLAERKMKEESGVSGGALDFTRKARC